ncbi:MAG: sigma 54-dependent Fis family transcriptional regulator [Myxococcales bacterium]|nr:sigma 54-dependent Fis family transcriptional regulator [Myxococcales bacterium]
MSQVRTGLLTTGAGGDVVLRRVVVRVVSGASRGAEALLEEGTLVIGTHPDADLRVDDPTVSRFHAELGLLAEGVRVRDLGSTNGTFVGESRIEVAVLPPSAELRVGKSRIEIVPADVPVPDAPPETTRFGPLVGQSATMRRAFGLFEGAAALDAPVLIEGEAGTGKSEGAEAIHHASARRGGPLVVLDLSVTSEVEAHAARAAGGTLVIERLDHASAPQASALVAVLDRRERGELDFRPIGTSRVDLRRRVEEGALRRDLYFHLAAVRVVLPPLRDRREDIPVLVAELAARLGHPNLGLSADELAPLASHAFQGNVRELARLLEHALSATGRPTAGPAPVITAPSEDDGIAALPFKEAKEQLVESFEARYVAALLARHEGNLSRAASEAGLDRNYLARLAKKHGLR